MSIESRLKQIEKGIGISDSETCDCSTFPHEIRTYMDEEDNHAAAASDERPPGVCERCKRPKDVIKLVVVHNREQARM